MLLAAEPRAAEPVAPSGPLRALGGLPAAEKPSSTALRFILLADLVYTLVVATLVLAQVARLVAARQLAAMNTDAARVAVHSVHQHTAPYTDGDAQRLLDNEEGLPLYVDFDFLDEDPVTAGNRPVRESPAARPIATAPGSSATSTCARRSRTWRAPRR